jgi:transcriptional regulator with XRE-family HTH domain
MADRIHREAEEFSRTPESRELDIRMDFAVNLLKNLKRKKMTQAEFCRTINMKPPQFTRIVQGDENITMRMIARIADGLGIPAARLFKAPAVRKELIEA